MDKLDTLATVDLGSNSFRLQICRNDNGQLLVLDSIKEVVRLGAGLDEDKCLTESVQKRALDCLARFAERLRDFPPEQVRVVATNTFRVAKNAKAFTKKAQEVLGFPIDIIAGREEARLIYVGVAHTLPVTDERRLVIDIGGGSTEFIIGQQLKTIVTESLPLGCVSYTMRYFPKEKVDKENLEMAILAARNEIQRIAPLLRSEGWQIAVGTSGSARALRDIAVEKNPENPVITLSLLYELAEKIIVAGSAKKADIAGMKPDREEVFAGGLAVMIAAFEELKIEQMIVVDVALREGVLYDLIGRSLSQDMRDKTVTHFERQYSVDREQANRVAQMAEKLINVLEVPEEYALTAENRKYLLWAAKLHEIGVTISHTAYHKHSAYIVANADMPGFSRQDQTRIARLIMGHRGDLKKMKEEVSSERVWLAILILRLATLLCRGRKAPILPEHFKLVRTPKKMQLWVDADWLKHNPLTLSALLQEQVQWAKIGRTFSIKGIS